MQGRVEPTPGQQARARASKPTNCEQTAMDKVIAANPPLITWRHNGKGVQIATCVDDPHTETGARK